MRWEKTSSELSDQGFKGFKETWNEICRYNDHLFLSAGSGSGRVT